MLLLVKDDPNLSWLGLVADMLKSLSTSLTENYCNGADQLGPILQVTQAAQQAGVVLRRNHCAES
jgi:hypothetical protein